MPKFSSCLSSKYLSDDRAESSERALIDGPKANCEFCNVTKERGFNIVYEDNDLIAFTDRSPHAKEHVLIIPRKHIVDTVRQLEPIHIPLLQQMSTLATTLYPNHTLAGYHIPPFSSVPHLHLHVFVPPFSQLAKIKYRVSGSADKKGLGWFITDKQVLGSLERGKRIGLSQG